MNHHLLKWSGNCSLEEWGVKSSASSDQHPLLHFQFFSHNYNCPPPKKNPSFLCLTVLYELANIFNLNSASIDTCSYELKITPTPETWRRGNESPIAQASSPCVFFLLLPVGLASFMRQGLCLEFLLLTVKMSYFSFLGSGNLGPEVQPNVQTSLGTTWKYFIWSYFWVFWYKYKYSFLNYTGHQSDMSYVFQMSNCWLVKGRQWMKYV